MIGPTNLRVLRVLMATVHIHGDVIANIQTSGAVVLGCCHGNHGPAEDCEVDGLGGVATDTAHVTYTTGDVSDIELDALAKALMERRGQKWRAFAGNLQVPLYMVEEVEHQGESLYWKYSRVLHVWVELSANNNRQRLVEILSHNKMADIAYRTLNHDEDSA